jgi:hypothetical protein
MTDEDPAVTGGRLETAAYVLASTIVAVPLIVLLLTQAVLLQLNPGGLGLNDAVLWIPCGVAAAVMMVATARVFSRLAASAGDRAVLRYPSLIVQLQVGFTIAAVALLLLTPGIRV